MEHHTTACLALGEELKKRGLLGWLDQPIAEILLNTTPPFTLDVVPNDGADPKEVEAAITLCKGWDWGGRKPPKVVLANPWREPHSG